jgi:CheY-like chemotaxis protein
LARKILLADDSVTAQNMGRKILADAGYEVITVNNGSAALKRIAEIKPDVIVLDVYMPGYSGLEVCQRLKESSDTARIPVLLTVGKLEPFKPEEAKRVRAEAFIVKPFEASELLSALTKLEDKIVPRSDSSKPGRFARAIAAVEEGRYDKSVAIEEDSGWKNRISFPRKKREKPVAPEDEDDPAIYNAVNRDLKTVIVHKPEHAQPVAAANQPAVREEAHVDLGALVAHGLPKDVTPEEIAALAAAAAQVQGITENASSEPLSSPSVTAAEIGAGESNKPAELTSSQTETAANEVKAAAVKSESAPVAAWAEPTAEMAIVAPSETQSDETPTQAAIEPAASTESSGEVVATFAPEKPEQKEETKPESKPSESAEEEPVSAWADALPSIASFASDVAANSGNGASAHALSTAAEFEPITMAVAASHVAAPSRWTAVAVALAPEETSIALEEEMRKAQAAALAASVPDPAPLPVEDRVIEDRVEPVAPAPVTETPVAQAEPTTGSVIDSPAPANEETSVATASNEAVATEIKAVTTPEPEPSPAAAETPVEPTSTFTPAIVEAVDVPPISAARESNSDIEAADAPAASIATDLAAEVPSTTARYEAAVAETEPVEPEGALPSADGGSSADQHQPETANSTISVAEEPAPDIPQVSEEPANAAATQETSGGLSDMAKKESEIAATTAAAWASWRRIRETADGRGAENASEKDSQSGDEAAMAVAAGAEKAPQDSSDAEVTPEIASIVDSVLADLRPKIVEEISRKLGKKQ